MNPRTVEDIKKLHIDFSDFLSKFSILHSVKIHELVGLMGAFLAFAANQCPDRSEFCLFLEKCIECEWDVMFDKEIKVNFEIKDLAVKSPAKKTRTFENTFLNKNQ